MMPHGMRLRTRTLGRQGRGSFRGAGFSRILGTRDDLTDLLSVPQRHAGFDSCGSPAVVLKLAIYENVIDSLRELRRLLVSCFVDNCGRIEDRDIRKKSRHEQATIAELFALGGEGSDLSNRLPQWQ